MGSSTVASDALLVTSAWTTTWSSLTAAWALYPWRKRPLHRSFLESGSVVLALRSWPLRVVRRPLALSPSSWRRASLMRSLRSGRAPAWAGSSSPRRSPRRSSSAASVASASAQDLVGQLVSGAVGQRTRRPPSWSRRWRRAWCRRDRPRCTGRGPGRRVRRWPLGGGPESARKWRGRAARWLRAADRPRRRRGAPRCAGWSARPLQYA